jgi:hypothetical protein
LVTPESIPLLQAANGVSTDDFIFSTNALTISNGHRILEELGLVAAEWNTRLHPFEAVTLARPVAVNYE